MRFRKKVLVLCLIMVLSVAAGCGKQDTDNTVDAAEKIEGDAQEQQEESEAEKDAEEIPDDGHFHGEYIITGEYAKDRIGAEDVLFIDARGWQKAVLGTLKGAIATTWQDLCTCQEGQAGDADWGKIPAPDDLEGRLGELGITKDKEIIVFADTLDGWGDDARLVWEFLAAGFEDVKMIDGGYAAAKAAGAETQLFASGSEPGEVTVDSIDNTHVMTTEELQANYDEYTIVDVRTDEEYNGAILYNEAQGGHLPGAIHVRYTDLFQEDGTLKPNSELAEMFESAGVDKEDKVVTYCTGGIRSAYTQLVLEMCGYENTWNYDQSFWRWAVVGEVE
ncbi:sulfurtransferase [Lachnoclostridium phocaeense]|uniref:sulfurtransferase n=1 Tax=Lachnoclostridium phocaeense TaxID=1871021 RepID=UPI00248E4EDA|nr:rhodanese-like domain-containing protein [Lachnoclostridium phocaeense]